MLIYSIPNSGLQNSIRDFLLLYDKINFLMEVHTYFIDYKVYHSP
jgi:hypothetical protein